jgi:hypothetical protein
LLLLHFRAMPETNQNRRANSALWVGLLITVLGVASNFLYIFNPPGQNLIPWVSLVIPAIGLFLMVRGLQRAFTQPQIYGGKVAGSILTTISLVLFVFGIWGFRHSRDVPNSSAAPQVGQKVPEFTLADTNGQPVSLSQLLSTGTRNPQSSAPAKAVLLIFYRGYW